MLDLNTDEPFSLRPGPPRSPGRRTWLIRGAFLSIHLAMIGAALVVLGSRESLPILDRFWTPSPPVAAPSSPPPSRLAPGPRGKTSPPASRPDSRLTPIPSVRGNPPGPALARREPTPARAQSLKESRGAASEKETRIDPEKVLAGLGLEREGGSYLLPGEAEATRAMAKLSEANDRHRGAKARLEMLQQGDVVLDRLERERVVVEERIERDKIFLDANPGYVNNFIEADKNLVKQDLLQAREDLSVIDRDLKLGRLDRPGPAARQELARDKARLEGEIREGLSELRRQVDTVDAEYRRLADNPEVKAALKGLKGRELGPSDKFAATRRRLVDLERGGNGP